ncbi:hypothetical protein AQUCO_00700799v1 [Aquilegia coerulea]|uniref:Pentatricopeptide repeat-containing protein n=1 Tax=Aquilegia coerulea TaxID=218851 RepID=A0A2G5ELQ0_AQUCA|nr:hypothetical protein AQUCO_00700799v1 [Aquilegia coerulea]
MGVRPDVYSNCSVLGVCSVLVGFVGGKQVHSYVVRNIFECDAFLDSSLIDMYKKCGRPIDCGCLNIQNMAGKNVVTWNSVIAGYGSHGECLKAIKLFNQKQAQGELPDEITSYTNFGLQPFREDYGIEPKMGHYVIFVDLWGRAGYLNEAYNFIKGMPIMEPPGNDYVELSSLYGEGKLWDKAANMRLSMKDKGLKKIPACSCIEMKDEVNVFLSWDSSSPTLEIYGTLSSLTRNMKTSKLV